MLEKVEEVLMRLEALLENPETVVGVKYKKKMLDDWSGVNTADF